MVGSNEDGDIIIERFFKVVKDLGYFYGTLEYFTNCEPKYEKTFADLKSVNAWFEDALTKGNKNKDKVSCVYGMYGCNCRAL